MDVALFVVALLVELIAILQFVYPLYSSAILFNFTEEDYY